jgi:hypothetical protein
MGKKRRRQQTDDGDYQLERKKQHVDVGELPEGVHHYEHVSELPWDIQQ